MKIRSKLEKLTPLVVGTCMLTLVAACGSDDDDNDSSVPQQEERQEGQFRVVLTPVNPNVAGDATGTGEFNLAGDNFDAMINVDGAPAAIHMQHVHAGRACPTAADDANGDGFVDAVEAGNISGGALIPLDSDLRSQSAGGTYPTGMNYDYSESTSYLAMLADLRLPDTDASDTEVKLGANENLDLEGRVVEVHGVPASTVLPATVQGVDGQSGQQTLPILCGVIERVDTGTTTGDTGTGTTTGDTGTTTGDTGTGTTTGDTGTTTGDTGTGTTTGDTGTGTTTGTTGTTTGTTTGLSGL